MPRVIFTFDEQALDGLKKLAEKEGTSMAEVVRQALSVYAALREQKDQGFGEVIVRNPKKDKERVMVVR